jgi:DNA-binding transcriptional LysR family regulator
MNLLLLRSLVAIADAGGFTEAAERLKVSQPALTRRIQQLERYLGAPLLTRSRNGTRLTEIGKLVEREARLLLDRFEHLREQVSAHQRLEAGTVRIGGGATVVSFVLPWAIAGFQADYPGIRFQVKEAGSREVANDVVSGKLELGLVTLPVEARELQLRPIMDDRIALVARQDHPLAARGGVRVRDLEGLGFVGFEAGSAIRHIIDGALREAGVEMNVVMELRSIPAILRMVATTGNLAFVSELGVESHSDIRELAVHGLAIQRKLALVWKRGSGLSAPAQAFADCLIRRACDPAIRWR